MRKKRRVKRVHLIYYLLVFEKDTDRLLGHVVDVSTEGMKLMSKEPIEEGTEFDVRMVLPDELGESSRQLAFRARCAWCNQNVYSDFYGAGFHIENIDAADVRLIRRLVDEFGY